MGLILSLMCVFSLPHCGQATELIKADIVKINDGDTVRLIIRGQEITLRLLDIDCFENKRNNRVKWQAETYGLAEVEVLHRGKQSAEILKTLLIANQANIYVSLKGRDYYRRRLGTLFVLKQGEMVNINRYMLQFGGCMPYLPKPKNWEPKQ